MIRDTVGEHCDNCRPHAYENEAFRRKGIRAQRVPLKTDPIAAAGGIALIICSFTMCPTKFIPVFAMQKITPFVCLNIFTRISFMHIIFL